MISCDVITIVKDGEYNIIKTLKSVSSQSYNLINHIIVDGNSIDSTLNIIHSFNHSKNCRVYSQNIMGIATAFNEGISNSSGNLVIFLNGGDSFVDSNVITNIVDSYETNNWLWAFGETISVSHKGYFKKHNKQYSKWKQELFLYGNPICHQSTIFSKEIIQKVGLYDECLSLEMDYDFNVRTSLIAQPYLLHFPISYYDTTGISSVRVFKSYKIHRELRKKYFTLPLTHNFVIDSVCFFKAVKRFCLTPIKLYL